MNCYECNFIIFICNLVLLSLLLFFLFKFVLRFCNTVYVIVMQIKLLVVVAVRGSPGEHSVTEEPAHSGYEFSDTAYTRKPEVTLTFAFDRCRIVKRARHCIMVVHSTQRVQTVFTLLVYRQGLYTSEVRFTDNIIHLFPKNSSSLS